MWLTLSRPQKGERVVLLLKNYTGRKLAQALACGEKDLRDCVDLWQTRPLKSQLQLSDKALLKTAKDFRALQSKWKKLSRGAPGKSLHRKLVSTLVNWFVTNMGHPCLWEGFFLELDWSPEARNEVYRGAPWNYCQPDGDWDTIIQAAMPPGNYLQQTWREYEKSRIITKNRASTMESMPAPEDYPNSLWSCYSLFGFYRRWLGAWLPRCVLEGRFARSAMRDARERLRAETLTQEAKLLREENYGVDWRRGPPSL